MMTTLTSQKTPQKFHPLSLLAQLMSRQVSGCLHVSSAAGHWFIYLEQGKLTYATNSLNPFERLDRQLFRLSHQVPSLISAVRVQVRLLFDVTTSAEPLEKRDYEAICWLVEQQYISATHASKLIEGLAKDVLEPFLALKEGAYEIVRQHPLNELPMFTQLELRPLVEYCQNQMLQKQAAKRTHAPEIKAPAPAIQRFTPSAKASVVSEFLQKSAEATQVETTQPVSAPSAVPPQLHKQTYTIACIDDSPTVLHAIESFLDDRMFSVLMINSPVQALMQIVRSKPDLILLDVEMPNLDGYELCSLLRRHPLFKQTPIIMVTGHTGFVDRAKAKLVRASGYLTKPFTQSDLLKMVFKHLT